MILLDFNNSASILYAGVIKEVLGEELKIFKKPGGVVFEYTDDIEKKMIKAFFNIFIDAVKTYKEKLARFGQLVICGDYRKDMYWRKQIFPDYKLNRDAKKTNEFDELSWSKFNQHRKFMLDVFESLGFKTLADLTTVFNDTLVSLEADEIIGRLALTPGAHVIVSNDGDMRQIILLNPNAKIYDPIFRKMGTWKTSDLRKKNIKECLVGQKKDNIKSIFYQKELSPQFVAWMKSTHDIEVGNDLLNEIKSDKFYNYRNQFTKQLEKKELDEMSEGKRSRRSGINVFNKNGLSGDKAEKFIEEYGIKGIDKFIDSNPHYRIIYNMNEKLYRLDMLPKEIEDVIIERFKTLVAKPVDKNIMSELKTKLKLGMMDLHKLKQLAK